MSQSITIGRRALLLLALSALFVIGALAGVPATDLDLSAPGEHATIQSASAASAVVPGCVFLSASEDPGGQRHGFGHPYEDFPVLVMLSCRTMDDAERAMALLPVEFVAISRSASVDGVNIS